MTVQATVVAAATRTRLTAICCGAATVLACAGVSVCSGSLSRAAAASYSSPLASAAHGSASPNGAITAKVSRFTSESPPHLPTHRHHPGHHPSPSPPPPPPPPPPPSPPRPRPRPRLRPRPRRRPRRRRPRRRRPRRRRPRRRRSPRRQPSRHPPAGAARLGCRTVCSSGSAGRRYSPGRSASPTVEGSPRPAANPEPASLIHFIDVLDEAGDNHVHQADARGPRAAAGRRRRPAGSFR